MSLTLAGVIAILALPAEGRAGPDKSTDPTHAVQAQQEEVHQQPHRVPEQALERCRVGSCFDTTVSVPLRLSPPAQAPHSVDLALRGVPPR